MRLGGPVQGRIEDQGMETFVLALGVDEAQEGRAQVGNLRRLRKSEGGAQEERRQREARQPAMTLRS
jgi:hypothetical protein